MPAEDDTALHQGFVVTYPSPDVSTKRLHLDQDYAKTAYNIQFKY